MIRALTLAACIALLSTSTGCAILRAAATGGDVGTAVTQSVDARGEAIDKITGNEERAVGQAAAIAVIANYGGLVMDEEVIRYVNEVGNSVAKVGERKARRRSGEARIVSRRVFVGVLNHKSINAFGLPGGYLFVTRGLLESLQSESELAWVLGHEMAHVDYEHGLSALKAQVGGGAFLKGKATLNMADKYVFGKVADWFADFMVTHGFDRNAEREADLLGVQYATSAGYDSLGAYRVLTTLKVADAADPKKSADKSHDTPAQRYERLRGVIGAKTGGAMGAERYDGECLRRLEAYVLASSSGTGTN